MRAIFESCKAILIVVCATLGVVYFFSQLVDFVQVHLASSMAGPNKSQVDQAEQKPAMGGVPIVGVNLDSTQPVSPARNDLPAKAAPADIPAILRKAKEDRDAELRLVHLELCDEAETFLNTLRSFEGAINEWGIEYNGYRILSPTIAALGQVMREPERVSTNKHVTEIKAAARKLSQARRQYELSVERIKIAYSQKLANVELPSSPRAPIEDPKTEFEPSVGFAFWLSEHLEEVIKTYFGRLLLFNQHSMDETPLQLASTLESWKLEYFKSLGDNPDCTAFEKERAHALHTFDLVYEALQSVKSDKNHKMVEKEIAKSDALLNEVSNLINQEKFPEAQKSLSKAKKLIETAIDEAAKRQAAAQFENEFQKTPKSLWESDGGEKYLQISKLVDTAQAELDCRKSVSLYDQARFLCSKLHYEVRLAAATRLAEKGELFEAIKYASNVCFEDQENKVARSLFARLLQSKPEYLLGKAFNTLEYVNNEEDKALCSNLLLVAYRKKKLQPPDELERFTIESTKRLFERGYSERPHMLWWGLCDHLVDNGLSKEISVEMIRKGLEQVKRLTPNSSDPLRLIDMAAVYRGLAKRIGATDLMSECDRSFQSLCEAYYRRQRGIDRAPQSILDEHFQCTSLFVSGDYETAFKLAQKPGHMYTWSLFAVCAAFDKNAAGKLSYISQQFHHRKPEIVSWGRTGLFGNSEYDATVKRLAALEKPEGGINYDGSVSFDDDLVFQLISSRGGNKSLSRMRDHKHMGLFIFSQYSFTESELSTSKNHADLLIEMDRWEYPAHNVARLTSLALNGKSKADSDSNVGLTVRKQ